ncbi:MAG: iron complex outermembrane receptor protein [Halieaceae bacterium]|jgi:iron complex outermembrane receptor protein
MKAARTRISIATACAIGVTINMVGISTASAQQSGDKSATLLEEILVTARKRKESIQDVPISISAFSAGDIEALGSRNLSELSDFTPGFTFETFGGRRGAEGDVSRPVIRGQSNIIGEGNAAIFVDGILYTESILSFPMDIVERVEVLRGPQAAQFGRSTFSGAINLITKRGTNEFENRVNLRAVQDAEYEVNLSSRGPLIKDELFYFVHGRYYTYGGEYENELDGRTVGGEGSIGFNGGLQWNASENLNLDFTLGYNEDEDDHAAQRVLDRFSNNCFLDQARQYYCGEIEGFESVTLEIDRLNGEDGLTREVLRATGALTWDIGGSGYMLTASGGYNDATSTFGNDQTNLGDGIQFAGGIFVRVEDSDRQEYSGELRFESPVDERLRYQVGAFMYERNRERLRRFPGTQNIITDFGEEIIENQAVFGSIEYDFTDKLTATAELRYQEDTIENVQASGNVVSATFDSVQPRFTLNYALTEDLMVYASIAQGNKPGAINADPRLTEEFRTADEEESWNYEAGFKSTLFENRMTLNASIFYIDWTQQQLTQSGEFNNIPISFIANAGETTVWGFELEGDAVLTENWRAGFSFALANATFDENCDRVQGAELTGIDCVSSVTGAPGGSVAGNQTPIAPETMATLNSTYTIPMASGRDFFIRGDYSFMSRKYAQVHNFAYVGSRSLMNLKAGITSDDWSLTVFVNNVFNDLTPSTIVRFADLVNLNIGPQENPAQNNVPGSTVVERGFLVDLARSRRAGVSLTYNF